MGDETNNTEALYLTIAEIRLIKEMINGGAFSGANIEVVASLKHKTLNHLTDMETTE